MPIPPQDNSHLIVETAQRITFSRGVSVLRMAGLATELGMSKKTLYVYYPSKEALLEAMMETHFDHYDRLFGAVLAASERDFLSRLQETMRLGWEMNSAMTAEATQDFRRSAPVLLRTFEQKKAAAMQVYFHALLAEGQQQGFLRPELTLPIVVDILMEVITYRLTLNELQHKQYTVSEAFTTFYQLLFAGMLTDTARQEFVKFA